MKKISMVIRVVLCAAIIIETNSFSFAYRNDDQLYAYQPVNPTVYDFQNNFNQPQAFNNRAMDYSFFNNLQTPLSPNLIINQASMRLPEITVFDVGNSVWSFEKSAAHFNADTKSFDSYQADIKFKSNDVAAERHVSMNLGSMKFDSGAFAPRELKNIYRDEKGNTFERDRTRQTSQTNSSYYNFVQFYEKQDRLASANQNISPTATSKVRPVEPPIELVAGFAEKWKLSTTDDAGIRQHSTIDLRVDAIQNDSDLHRFISGYTGSIKMDRQTVKFTVASPHESNGDIKSLSFLLEGKGTPSATITWKPIEGKTSQAFSLLRENVPAPILVGPRSSFRLNGVDLVESPLHVTAHGDIADKQIGRPQDLVNLLGKEDLGISVSFTAPNSQSTKSSFSLGNSLRNLWYRATGQWSNVSTMRQQLTTLRDQEPGKFLLAARFSDPNFMGVKELRSTIQNASHLLNDLFEKKAESKLPTTGLHTNDHGQEIFETNSGHEINVTLLRNDVSGLNKDWVNSFDPVKNSFANSSNRLVASLSSIKFSDLPKKDGASESSWTDSLKRFFIGDKEIAESPTLESELQFKKTAARNIEIWADGKNKEIQATIAQADTALKTGDFEKAEVFFNAAQTEAAMLVTDLSAIESAFSNVTRSIDSLQSVRKYTSPCEELKTKGTVSKEDLILIENMVFTFGDKTPLEMREKATTIAVQGYQSLEAIEETGLVNKKSSEILKTILVDVQNDALKGLAAQQKQIGQIVTNGKAAIAAGDFLDGMVLGSAMLKERTNKSSLYGQLAGYLNPYGWVAVSRDAIIAFTKKDTSYLRGAWKGDFLKDSETNLSALRGQMAASVVLLVPTAARDASKAVIKMYQTQFREGKMATAVNIIGTLPAIKVFSKLNSFKNLGTTERIALNEERLSKLSEELKTFQATNKTMDATRIERKMLATSMRIETLRSFSAEEKIVVNATTVGLKSAEALPKFASNSEEFSFFLQKVRDLDFSTPPNKAVFWSGRGNYVLAQQYAELHGCLTINMTEGGQWIQNAMKRYPSTLTESQADIIWKVASQKYALSASGEVNVFARGASYERIFYKIEDRILKENGRVNKWIFRGYK